MTHRMLVRANGLVEDWLLTPETNAAGRLGVFRILYAVFYLWHLSAVRAGNLGGIPREFSAKPVLLVEWLPAELPAVFFETLEIVLVGALIVLLVGYRTRIATTVVLIAGSIIEGFFVTTDFEHSTIMIAALIPGAMLFVGDWSAKYSLDALLRDRAHQPPIDLSDSSPQFVLPIHFILAVLAFLFVSSGVYKLLPGANWLVHPDNFGNIVLQRNVELARLGLPQNPIAVLVATTPGLELTIRYLVVIFELAFIFVFFSRAFTFFILSWALFFHSLNAIFLLVTFTPILITYALFIDWESIGRWLRLTQVSLFGRTPFYILIGATVFGAIAAATFWNTTPLLRDAMNLGGLIDARTIWYPILPISTVAWAIATYQLVKPALGSLGGSGFGLRG